MMGFRAVVIVIKKSLNIPSDLFGMKPNSIDKTSHLNASKLPLISIIPFRFPASRKHEMACKTIKKTKGEAFPCLW